MLQLKGFRNAAPLCRMFRYRENSVVPLPLSSFIENSFQSSHLAINLEVFFPHVHAVLTFPFLFYSVIASRVPISYQMAPDTCTHIQKSISVLGCALISTPSIHGASTESGLLQADLLKINPLRSVGGTRPLCSSFHILLRLLTHLQHFHFHSRFFFPEG
jgi:hypothetical protein